MSNSKKGMVLVVAGAALLAIATAVVYFTVIGPRSERKRVQREVESWGEMWSAARTCLVGPEPRSSDGYEAVLLRDLISAEDTTSGLAGCLDEIQALRRGDGYTAGERVEAGWSQIEKVWKRLGEAHAWRTAKTPNRPRHELHAALGRAVAEMDAAYAALRAAADLPPDAPAGAALARLQSGTPMASPDGAPLTPSELDVTGDVVAAFGTSQDDRTWLVRQPADGVPTFVPIGFDVLPAVDGGGWAVWTSGSPDDGFELRAGPVDAQGDPASDGVLITRGAQLLRPVFAAGSDSERAILYQENRGEFGAQVAHWVVRSRDGGSTWTDRVLLHEGGDLDALTLRDLAGARIDTFFRTDSGTRWLALDPASPSGEISLRPLAFAPRLPPCRAGEHTWFFLEDSAYVAVGDEPARPVPGSSGLAHPHDCRGDRMIALDATSIEPHAHRVLVCRPGACAKAALPVPLGAGYAVLMSASRGPLVAVESGGVLVIWAGDPDNQEPFQPRHLVRLADGQTLASLIERGERLHLVTRSDAAAYLVPAIAPEG